MVATLRPNIGLHFKFPISETTNWPIILVWGTEIRIHFPTLMSSGMHVAGSESRTSETSGPLLLMRDVVDKGHCGSSCSNAVVSEKYVHLVLLQKQLQASIFHRPCDELFICLESRFEIKMKCFEISLTHYSLVMQRSIRQWVITDADDGLLSTRFQTIISTDTDGLSRQPLGIVLSSNTYQIRFLLTKCSLRCRLQDWWHHGTWSKKRCESICSPSV